MVKLTDLVELSRYQLDNLNDSRLETAKLFSKVLNQFNQKYVDLNSLNQVGNKMTTDVFKKKDLMKMLRVNYNNVMNEDRLQKLMDLYNLNDFNFKPL